jgi:PKD repeat protein
MKEYRVRILISAAILFAMFSSIANTNTLRDKDVASSAFEEKDVNYLNQVHLDLVTAAGNPVDTICAGAEYLLRIWIENDVTLSGYTLGFRLSSDDGATWSFISQDGGYGNSQALTVEADCRMYPVIDVWGTHEYAFVVSEKSMDGQSPDTLFLGAVNTGGTGLQAGPLEHMMTLHLMADLPDGIETLCVDSTYVPPAGPFIFSSSGGTIYPAVTWSSGGLCWSVDGCSLDSDDDGVEDDLDNCPNVYNPFQDDNDADGFGDLCDNCPDDYNPGQEDSDGDGIGDICELFAPNFDASPRIALVFEDIFFTDLSESQDPITDWYWDFGDGQYSIQQNPVHQYSDTGHYDIKLRISNPSGADSIVKADFIAVRDSAMLDFEIFESFNYNCLAIASADMDHDNNTDLILTDVLDKISIAYGNGAGGFYLIDYSQTSTGAISTGFINSDTLIDFVVAGNTQLEIFQNMGNRVFQKSTINYSGLEIGSTKAGYFNDDADLDLIITPNHVFLGDGSGGFGEDLTFPSNFKSVDVSDFNNDGIDDVVISADNGYAEIWLNDGTGNFMFSGSTYTGSAAYSLTTANALADFDRDGNSDFALIIPHIGPYHESKIFIGFGDGQGGIDHTDTSRIIGVCYYLVASDVNRDNNIDLTVANGTNKELEIFLGSNTGLFDSSVVIDMQTDEVILTLASADFNRDGNPDFAAGKFFPTTNAHTVVALNLLPPEPIVEHEMITTGYQYVTVEIENPNLYIISRRYTTVAGSDYWRLDADNDGFLDESSVDYNLGYGEYAITITNRPNSPNDGYFDAGVRIDGSIRAIIFKDYLVPFYDKANNRYDSLIFYYEFEPLSSISPGNGLPASSLSPTFGWSGLTQFVDSDTINFQLDRYYDFRDPINDVGGITNSFYETDSVLGKDSVFYWRIRGFESGVWSDFSRTFAVYIPPYFVGDANGDDRVNVSDAVFIVNYVFIGGDAPSPIESGDANCDESVNVSDAVAIINYVFIGGYPPGDPDHNGIPDC